MATDLKKAFATTVNLVLNEKVEKDGKKKFSEIATVQLPVPLVSDFNLDSVEIKLDEKTKEPIIEDGLPIFVDETQNWLQDAIIAAVKAQSRNKFTEGELKDGQQLATNFEMLIATGGGRNGDALKARHEARNSFKAYLESRNLKAVVVKLLAGLFGDANSIAVAKDGYVEKLEKHANAWITTLKETEQVRYARTIETLSEAVQSRNVSMEDMDGTEPEAEDKAA